MEASTGPGKFYVGLVEILSGLVKFTITSIQIMGFGSRLWNLQFVGPVDKNISCHAGYIRVKNSVPELFQHL